MSSSGAETACARCQARRSGSMSWIGCVRQGAVDLAPLVRLGRAVHGGPDERMTERHRGVQRQQAFLLHGVRDRVRDPKLLRGPPQQRWIAERLGRRQE